MSRLQVRHGLETSSELLNHLWEGPQRIRDLKGQVESLAEGIAEREGKIAQLYQESQEVRTSTARSAAKGVSRDIQNAEDKLQSATER